MAFNLNNFKVIVQMRKSRDNGGENGSTNGNVATLKEGIKGYIENTSVGHESEFVIDEKLMAKLPTDFREQAEQFRHLGAYVSKLPVDDIGIPEYLGFVSRGSDTQQKRNLVYPVGG